MSPFEMGGNMSLAVLMCLEDKCFDSLDILPGINAKDSSCAKFLVPKQGVSVLQATQVHGQ